MIIIFEIRYYRITFTSEFRYLQDISDLKGHDFYSRLASFPNLHH